MNRPLHHTIRGSVILVVLCFVAVLGVGLASYLALSTQAMKFSNRSARTDYSRQLAELGIEEALRAFNTNNWADWSSGGLTADWTVSGTTATCTMAFSTDKFGQGVIGSVKIRVDNYNAAQLNSAWISTANYRADNLVSYTDGQWYRSTNIQSNKTPSSSSGYWIQEHSAPAKSIAWMAWTSGTSYIAGNMATRNGYLYRCINPHSSSSSNAPPNVSYWLNIPYATFGSDLQYSTESMVFWTNTTWYSWNGSTWLTTGTGMPPSWYYNSGTTYSIGATVRSGTTWYRYINSTPAFGYPVTDNTYWNTAQSLATTAAAAWNWSSAISYNLNDVVYHSGTNGWYRSIAASNTNNTPSTSSAYWSTSPLQPRTWDSSWQYSINDTVYYNGKWFLSRTNSNYNNRPPTAPTYIDSNWASTDYTTWQWNSTSSYSVGDYRSYGGVWYRCLSAGSNKTPNNTSYWTASWSISSGVTTGGPVVYADGRLVLSDGSTIKTQLRASIAPAPLFPNAVAATSTLNFSSDGTVDSYDSNIGPYGGANIGYSAVVAAGGASIPSLTITSATIKGYAAANSAASAPYAPLASFGTGAYLTNPDGSVTSPHLGATHIDDTRVSRSPFIPKFDIQAVSGGTAIPAPSLTDYPLTLGTPGAVTPSIHYYSGDLLLDDNHNYITVIGPVVLYISGSLDISSNSPSGIRIAPTGSLRLVVGRNFRITSAGGGIQNQTSDPKKLVVLLSRSGSDTFNYHHTTQPFYGVIYLPNSSSTFTVGNGVTIHGAISAQNILFSGTATVHYDTQLRYATFGGVDQPWTVTEWRELDVTEQATLP